MSAGVFVKSHEGDFPNFGWSIEHLLLMIPGILWIFLKVSFYDET